MESKNTSCTLKQKEKEYIHKHSHIKHLKKISCAQSLKLHFSDYNEMKMGESNPILRRNRPGTKAKVSNVKSNESS